MPAARYASGVRQWVCNSHRENLKQDLKRSQSAEEECCDATPSQDLSSMRAVPYTNKGAARRERHFCPIKGPSYGVVELSWGGKSQQGGTAAFAPTALSFEDNLLQSTAFDGIAINKGPINTSCACTGLSLSITWL